MSAYVISDLRKEEQNCELPLLNCKMVDHKVIRSPIKDTDSIEDLLILFTARPFAVSAEVSSEN